MLPNRPLTDVDLRKYIHKSGIPHFRGVFMRNELPKRVWQYESGIVNLDTGNGTHWTAYIKSSSKALYFDSFGNLRPPKELVSYLRSAGPCSIRYNYERQQNFTDFNCGHLVLKFLYENSIQNHFKRSVFP